MVEALIAFSLIIFARLKGGMRSGYYLCLEDLVEDLKKEMRKIAINQFIYICKAVLDSF